MVRTVPSLVALALCAVLVSPGHAADTPFRDATKESGLDFVHFNGMSGEMYYPEIMGPGAALFDADGDGDLDVYLAQGALLGPGKKLADATRPPADGKPPRDRLLRNDLKVRPDGRRVVRFVDVTEKSLPVVTSYGMGMAAGDVDNDGDVDLYVVGLTTNHLLRNKGDGTFEDVTARAGVGEDRWSAAASFDDVDRDGDLDLFVVNYLEFPLDRNPKCYAPSSRRDYCGPDAFKPFPDRLFYNRGDGTFEDGSNRLRADNRSGPGLGVVAADLTGDGRTDFYVANDGAANHLWVQRPDGTFTDEALLAGVAVNRQGRPEAGMGVALGDVDTDGDFDLLVTHLDGESNTLYLQQGGGLFEDRSTVSGLAAPSLPYTSFGTGFLDVENDGDLDLLAVNGAVRIEEDLARAGDPYPLGQPNQLFENVTGGGGPPKFREWTAAGGKPLPGFGDVEVSRGAAFGDVDNDGDVDVLVINNAGPARLLLNEAGSINSWLGLRVVDRHGRDALGARVEVRLQDGRSLWRRVHTDGSFASASDPRVLFGFGKLPPPVAVRVHWPDEKSTVEEWKPRLGRYTTLRRGEGEKPASKDSKQKKDP
jgi:enediyne biosynthesis protein E4